MTNRTKGLAVLAVLGVVAVAGAVYLLGPGAEQPAPLSLDDRTTTTPSTAPGTGSSGTGTATGASAAAVEGRWTVGTGSRAGYRVLEDRLGGLSNIEAVGRTDRVTGGFTVSGTTASGVEVVVDVASITSDSGFRDGRFRGSIMEADRFPTATFRTDEVDLPAVPEVGRTVEVPVKGTLTLKGVDRPVSTNLQVRRTDPGTVEVLGSVPVTFADFGIDTPRPPGLSVRDSGQVEFLVVARPAG